MKYKYMIITSFLVCCFKILIANPVEINSIEGQVYFRHGVEENWKVLDKNINLTLQDGIRTEKDSHINLIIGSKNIHINELCEVHLSEFKDLSSDDLFLILMSKKIKKFSIPEDTTKNIQNGRVSSVYGTDMSDKKGTYVSKFNNWLYAFCKTSRLAKCCD